ncbi:ClpXP protease specificity-enhancing factor [Pseudorhodoferax sp. Leaf274]|uniref:ClpXP protease specificity-enhancing factor n=1 Tax=Pseudorhodoferax sp. Leaf274 TaxID=1736318 RepID=UPI0007031DDD|nr:ClpXP protease specificity-enhancing factor [Pseudorhodoferax sp. Leaf274]KQP48491.1 starvation protein B [Pseudorhodoferax sp. Leaf274]
MNALDATSTRPYLIRALYEWCTDNGFTPYIAVLVDETVQVPREYVKDGEIVLNVSFDATSALKLGNDFIEFKARFAGTAREILVPIGRVIAIYARENGQGMAFPSPVAALADAAPGAASAPLPADIAGEKTVPKVLQLAPVDPVDEGDGPEPPKPGGSAPRPALKRVK